MRTHIKTMTACCLGYVTQAIIVNLAPILFIVFQNSYAISYEMLGRLILINFCVQITADIIALRVVDRVGYRAAGVFAHMLAVIGLLAMAVLPKILPPYTGLTIAVVIYAFGGGVIEVIISPIVDALPTMGKGPAMSLLHSFYCWGQVLVVLITTVVLNFLGAASWYVLPAAWAVVPLFNMINFFLVPLPKAVPAHEKTPLKRLFVSKFFIISLVLMMCAGASELAMSQWSSLFAENGLGVPKLLGDLLGPCLFAVLMGLGRTFYGIWGQRFKLKMILLFSGLLCLVCYAVTVWADNPIVALIGCAVCGLSICLMWPGTLSLVSERFPMGGTAMFGILAVFGDIGASLGPWTSGMVADSAGLKSGLMSAMVFPLLLVIGIILMKETSKNRG